MVLIQATVVYAGPGHSPKLSILHFQDTSNVVTQNKLISFCDNIKAFLSNQYTVTYEREIRYVDEVTGALTGAEDLPVVPLVYTGALAAQPVADATALLVRLKTGVVVGGRFLQGRVFVPGLAVTQMTGGNVTAAVVGQVATEMAEVLAVAGEGEWAVWSRKNGVAHPVVSVSAWQELATQRRRRG